jgi:hypothetical protein
MCKRGKVHGPRSKVSLPAPAPAARWVRRPCDRGEQAMPCRHARHLLEPRHAFPTPPRPPMLLCCSRAVGPQQRGGAQCARHAGTDGAPRRTPAVRRGRKRGCRCCCVGMWPRRRGAETSWGAPQQGAGASGARDALPPGPWGGADCCRITIRCPLGSAHSGAPYCAQASGAGGDAAPIGPRPPRGGPRSSRGRSVVGVGIYPKQREHRKLLAGKVTL